VNEDNWPKLGGHITLWADFNIETLNSRYDKILRMEMEHPEGVAKEMLENLTIHGVRDIKQIIAWNASILGPALEFGQSQLPLRRLHIDHEHANPQITAASTQTRVDHLIKLVDAPRRTLVVGLGSTSMKFRGGAHLTRGNQKNKREENLVRQLAHACNLANSRYGYIQTDDELVACRFSCKDTVWEAEIMPIPMELSGDKGMTTALAIWWMAMLAMPDGEESYIKPRDKMTPLTTKKRKANDDPQASVMDPDGNSGRMAGPIPPSGPNMEVLRTNAGIGSSQNSASHNTSFANVPNMGLMDTAAGVSGSLNSASHNTSFTNVPNMGLLDTAAGVGSSLNSASYNTSFTNVPNMRLLDTAAGVSGSLNSASHNTSFANVPNMGLMDTAAGVGGSLNSVSHNAGFASVSNMELLDTTAGVGGIPDSGNCNAGFPSFSNPVLADNSIGSPDGPNSEFETGVQLSDYINFLVEVDEPQRRQS
jgi:hypothetical protein